jgi:hypothetical protein
MPGAKPGDPASEKENSGMLLLHSLLPSLLLLVNHSREDGTVEDLDCDRGMSGDKCC